MDSRSISARSDVAVAATAPRVTPTPPRATRFGEVLSRTVVKSAETAMRALPGSPVMAVAVRGAAGPGAIGLPTMGTSSPQGPIAAGGTPTSALGTAGGSLASGLASGTGVGTSGAPGTGTPVEGGIEASLQQSQEMNLYYLQVQESVNAQNRSFTTISNLLKAQHDTVKTAIGNIR